MTDKPLVCVDFDGVLNTYEGWKGPDYLYFPRPGVRGFIHRLQENYTVAIFSTRPEDNLREWFEYHHVPYDKIVTKKVPALVYIDDRALRFDGNYDKVLYELERFQTHWEKQYMPIGDGEYTNPEIDEDGDRFQLAYESKSGWWAVDDNGITLWKEEVIYTLNELVTENELNKNLLTKATKECENLLDENNLIKQAIQEAYKTERTALGKSVLRQLLEQIQ